MSGAESGLETKPPQISKLSYGLLSLAGAFVPGLQRFYLRQKNWGWAYLVVGLLALPVFPIFFQVISHLLRVICVAEGLYILGMSNQDFEEKFNPAYLELEWTSTQKRTGSSIPQDPEQQLEAMRNQGLLTDAEYQDRRQRLRKGF